MLAPTITRTRITARLVQLRIRSLTIRRQVSTSRRIAIRVTMELLLAIARTNILTIPIQVSSIKEIIMSVTWIRSSARSSQDSMIMTVSSRLKLFSIKNK